MDPAADPWGTAIAASGVLAGIGLLVVLIAYGRGASLRGGGWLTGFGCVAFLTTASLGALDRVQASSGPSGEQTKQEEADTKAAESEAPAGDDAAGGDEAAADDAGTPPGPGDGTARPPPPIAAKIDWPSDPGALKTEVRMVLREVKTVAVGDKSCLDDAAVLNAWQRLSQIPPDVYPRKVEVLVKRLERCRNKILWARRYSVRQRRLDEREALAESLERRWADKGIKPITSLAGKDHERLRIGSRDLTESIARAIVDEKLKAELERAGFEKVTLSNGKKAWPTEFSPKSDKQVAEEELAAGGLGAPFELAS